MKLFKHNKRQSDGRRTAKLLAMLLFLPVLTQAQTFSVSVKNPSKTARTDVPVTIKLNSTGLSDSQIWNAKDATVKDGQTEISSQLDDIDKDGQYDELAFVTDLKGKEEKTFTITLHNTEQGHNYQPRTYAQLTLRNPKVKEKNKHDIYLDEIFFTPETKDPFHVMHHHGVAMESELIALRFYFDHRQTPDLYGKINKRLELHDTQFYTTKDQLALGYGDDILWVGDTYGFGAFRGWDGTKPTMLNDVRSRGQRIIATGPVRTIVEIVDRGWKPDGTNERLTATVRYSLWAGHRDLQVDVIFDRQPSDRTLFSTGLINVKDSKEIADDKGLRGLWGTDWPVALKDTVGHKRETVGMGIYVPEAYRRQTLKADKNNYGYVVAPKDAKITYYLSYTSDNETFGYHNIKDWTAYIKAWRKAIDEPVIVSIK